MVKEPLILEIHCCMCSETYKVTLELPYGWEVNINNNIYEECGFCPKHRIITEWLGAQCPGCVSGWGECGLWAGFACGEKRRKLTCDDLASIHRGICPRRANGFSMITSSGIEGENLSEVASAEAGQALVTAIQEYWEEYP